MAEFLKIKLSLMLVPILVLLVAAGCDSPTPEATPPPDYGPEYAAALEQLPIEICLPSLSPHCLVVNETILNYDSDVLCPTLVNPYCYIRDESSTAKIVGWDGSPAIVDEDYCDYIKIK